uniref:Uncharacterized protein n=1 Tax=Pipistrellus kuhlii TaxID=59472 RepID=A0A7J7VVF9_PIPKU|nr:hypothetical protein mPipKuh1_008318 [Pipistrellus kuhlii]
MVSSREQAVKLLCLNCSSLSVRQLLRLRPPLLCLHLPLPQISILESLTCACSSRAAWAPAHSCLPPCRLPAGGSEPGRSTAADSLWLSGSGQAQISRCNKMCFSDLCLTISHGFCFPLYKTLFI